MHAFWWTAPWRSRDLRISASPHLRIPEAFIGLTVVAIGTFLPELATSLIAAFRRQSQIVIGNIVSSNILNVLSILVSLRWSHRFP